MNRVELVGNLTRDPELTTTSGGISVCKFMIAVNRTYKNASGERDADFLNIVTWRGLADNCGKYLLKGSKVAVSGQIQTRSYEVEGQKRYAADIIADEVDFLNTPKASGSEKEDNDTTVVLTPVKDETMPF